MEQSGNLGSLGGREVWICSRTAPTYAGGLAAYQLGLARHMEAAGVPATFVAVEARHRGAAPHRATPQETLILGGAAREFPGFWSRMASRPAFHGLLEWWVARSCRIEVPAGRRPPAAVHFVGTGWDYFGFAAYAFSRRVGARFTVWPAVHPGEWGDDAVDLRLYRKADAVFCQSRFEIAHMVSRGLRETFVRLCPLPPMCAPDGNGERLRAALGIGQRPAVLFLARRDAGKGYPALLRAWPLLLRQFPEAVLLLAGPGGEEFLSFRDALPEGAWFDLGIPGESEKADALAACDVLCVPSAHESFGIVYAEAWSYSKPVVCGTAPAAREWVEAAGGGVSADQSAGELSAQIASLLGSDGRGRRMGEAGARFQREFLTWEKAAETHLNSFFPRD